MIRKPTQCTASECDNVGILNNFVKIYFGETSNYVDAAIASVGTNYTFTDETPSGYYGFPPASTTSASLRMKIQRVVQATMYGYGISN